MSGHSGLALLLAAFWHVVNCAVRHNLDMDYLTLPRTTATGEFIAFVHERMKEPGGMNIRYTFSGSVYFQRMKELGYYSVDRREIEKRIEKGSMAHIYSTCLV